MYFLKWNSMIIDMHLFFRVFLSVHIRRYWSIQYISSYGIWPKWASLFIEDISPYLSNIISSIGDVTLTYHYNSAVFRHTWHTGHFMECSGISLGLYLKTWYYFKITSSSGKRLRDHGVLHNNTIQFSLSILLWYGLIS